MNKIQLARDLKEQVEELRLKYYDMNVGNAHLKLKC